MVFGDSNACRPGNGRHCWPAMLQRNSGNQLRVINESVDGRTTRYDVGECNGLAVIEKKINNKALDYVLVALGTNDVKDRYGPPDALHVVDGLDKILNIIQAVSGGTHAVILTPPPLGRVHDGDLAGARNRIPAVVAKFYRYAASRDIPLIDVYAALDPDADLEPDGVHFGASGRKKVADIVREALLA